MPVAGAGGARDQPTPQRDVDGGDGAGWHVPDADEVLDRLRSVYDAEIPVNVVDAGFIYGREVRPTHSAGDAMAVWMSMTALDAGWATACAPRRPSGPRDRRGRRRRG